MVQVEVSLLPAYQQLARVASLSQDWDGEAGVPPTSRAVETARRLIAFIVARLGQTAGSRVLPYDISPLGGGGVIVEWRGTQQILSVEIGPDGELAYLHEDRRGAQRAYTEADTATRPEVLDLAFKTLLT